MVTINQNIFIKEQDSLRILKNITKYCSKCYKELKEDEDIYLNILTYEYICNSCACCLSEELDTKEDSILEEYSENSLF